MFFILKLLFLNLEQATSPSIDQSVFHFEKFSILNFTNRLSLFSILKLFF